SANSLLSPCAFVLELHSYPHACSKSRSRTMMESLIDWISSRSPFLLDCFRWILEAGFHGEKKVIQDEGLSDCKRILDLGCGTGILSDSLAKQQYTGIELEAAF